MKNILITDKELFKLRLKQWKVTTPTDINAVEFVQENYNDKGELTNTSTYNFFMNDSELKTLAESLLA